MKSEVQKPCGASLHVDVTPQEPLEDSLRILTDLFQVTHHVGDSRLLSYTESGPEFHFLLPLLS